MKYQYIAKNRGESIVLKIPAQGEWEALPVSYSVILSDRIIIFAQMRVSIRI